ncbi:AzlD domain-containing protein [Nocardioides sp. TRM66260-LWL]|uniref:AzlD domain-containing protein n=1 Tax=Nocardioides sp. TRM66260-LWL TaxID=2874478 RepID=UPI001CC52B40|nr:AzlD domain-containing protein [Nocardioides sp. TRM66260-LWL]MBZ5734347.1 AzlD domain-containing protein [Nocardioides sp. TRM66260-LWL]
MTPAWTAVLLAGVGCLALKVAGLAMPARVLERPAVARMTMLLPVALLAALVAVQTLADGTRLALDARVAGLGAAVLLLRLRAPFLLVVATAAGVAALLRALA